MKAKMELDSILRCANANCVHNRDGYNCTCVVVTLGADGKCALCRQKDKPAQEKVNKLFDVEASK